MLLMEADLRLWLVSVGLLVTGGAGLAMHAFTRASSNVRLLPCGLMAVRRSNAGVPAESA